MPSFPAILPSPELTATRFHRRLRRRRFLSITTLCLAAALASLFVGTGFLANQLETARESVALRTQLASRGQQLQTALTLIQDAETGQRGLLLTDNQIYLLPYSNAIAKLPAVLDQMRADNARDTGISPRVEIILELTRLKMAELAETIRLYDEGDRNAALALVRSDSGQHQMDELRAEIGLVTSTLRGQSDLIGVQLIEEMSNVKEWLWWAVFALTLSMGLAAYQLRSLILLRSKSETQLATQTAILNKVVDEIPAILGIWDRDSRYRMVNKAFERWRGRPRGTIIGKTIAEIIGEEEYLRSRPWIDRALAGESVTYEKEYLVGNDKGAVRHILVDCSPLFAEDGTVAGVISIAQDVTEHREERDTLKLLSERDSLTQLLNRAAFETWLTERCKTDRGRDLAVLFLDLDHFKPINDQHGHATGDAVLQEFAQRLQRSIRPTDVVARLGGDEFAIGLSGILSAADAKRISDKILLEATRPLTVGALTLPISSSMGVAIDASLEGGWQGLIARADEMVFSAKRGGRGRSYLHVAKQEQ